MLQRRCAYAAAAAVTRCRAPRVGTAARALVARGSFEWSERVVHAAPTPARTFASGSPLSLAPPAGVAGGEAGGDAVAAAAETDEDGTWSTVLSAVPNPRHAAPGHEPGWVADAAGALEPATVDSVNDLIEALDVDLNVEVAVVTLPAGTSTGVDPAQFGVRLFNHWGIGNAGTNNGMLVRTPPRVTRHLPPLARPLKGLTSRRLPGLPTPACLPCTHMHTRAGSLAGGPWHGRGGDRRRNGRGAAPRVAELDCARGAVATYSSGAPGHCKSCARPC